MKNMRRYNFFKFIGESFKICFTNIVKFENIYILGRVFLKATRGTEIGVTGKEGDCFL